MEFSSLNGEQVTYRDRKPSFLLASDHPQRADRGSGKSCATGENFEANGTL